MFWISFVDWVIHVVSFIIVFDSNRLILRDFAVIGFIVFSWLFCIASVKGTWKISSVIFIGVIQRNRLSEILFHGLISFINWCFILLLIFLSFIFSFGWISVSRSKDISSMVFIIIIQCYFFFWGGKLDIFLLINWTGIIPFIVFSIILSMFGWWSSIFGLIEVGTVFIVFI